MGEELRARAGDLVEEVLGADSREDAVDAAVAALTHLQAAGLTREDRISLAAVYGFELGVEEGSLEIANIRTLLERHGVPPADGNGVLRSTVAMVEEALIARPPVSRP
jgi:hypothetical protein